MEWVSHNLSASLVGVASSYFRRNNHKYENEEQNPFQTPGQALRCWSKEEQIPLCSLPLCLMGKVSRTLPRIRFSSFCQHPPPEMKMQFNSNYGLTLPQLCSGRILTVSEEPGSSKPHQKSSAPITLQTPNWNSQEFQCLILTGTCLPVTLEGTRVALCHTLEIFRLLKCSSTEPLWKRGQAERGATYCFLNFISCSKGFHPKTGKSFNRAPSSLWIFAVLLIALHFQSK